MALIGARGGKGLLYNSISNDGRWPEAGGPRAFGLTGWEMEGENGMMVVVMGRWMDGKDW